MTDKTRVIAARVPNEVADWIESKGSAREALEGLYEGERLDLSEFKRACDEKEIDYQMAVDRMVKIMKQELGID